MPYKYEFSKGKTYRRPVYRAGWTPLGRTRVRDYHAHIRTWRRRQAYMKQVNHIDYLVDKGKISDAKGVQLFQKATTEFLARK